MTFPVHGLIGAAFMSAAFFNGRRVRFYWSASIGFVLGIVPDVAGYVAQIFGWGLEGAVKIWFHEGAGAALLGWLAPIGLHLALDYFPHKVGDWWSTFWYLEIAGWILPALVLLFIYKRTKAI